MSSMRAFLVPYRPPLAWEALLAFLSGRAVRGVEQVDGEGWHRVVPGEGSSEAGLLAVRPAPDADALVVEIDAPLVPRAEALVARVRRVFGLDADPARIDAHLGRDPLLAPSVARLPGLRVPGAFDTFEMAVRAVLGQQVSVAAATTMGARLVARFGERLPGLPPGLDHRFPTPSALAALPPGDIAAIGLPAARARTIQALAAAVEDGRVRLEAGADPAETSAALVRLPGIGAWTASYLAMRALGHADAFPAGDLAVQKALGLHDAGGTASARAARAEARAEAWRPWRAFGVLHVWHLPPRSDRT